MVTAILNRLWSSIADKGRALARLPHYANPETQATTLAEELLSESGEASGAVRAEALVEAYRALSPEQRHRFQVYLADHFLPEPERLKAAASRYLQEQSPANIAELTEASEPPRQELLRRMNVTPGATKLLVEMRADILAKGREAIELRPLEQDLHHLLSSWFNRGFLELRRIDWNTSAAILEKLIAYEAVHEIHGWEDLRRRLGPDRRCFAFFHPALSDEPLIFVEVALCNGLASEVAPLLSMDTGEGAGARADSAIFYSISNCQAGLRGISFGNFLIKQVVEELRHELPQLKRFATLSPVPGFRAWLDARLAAGDETLFAPEDRALLTGNTEDASDIKLAPLLAFLLADAAREKFAPDEERDAKLRPVLMRLCAQHLTANKEGRGPDDYVARFHLNNGARLERVNWRGNNSKRGQDESYGLMVNYLYDPEMIEANHEKFVTQGRVAYGAQIAELIGDGSWRAYGHRLARRVQKND
jgi:malonyl-CoA decarboxylase